MRKLPITQELERAGNYMYDDRQLDIKYDDHEVVNLQPPYALHVRFPLEYGDAV